MPLYSTSSTGYAHSYDRLHFNPDRFGHRMRARARRRLNMYTQRIMHGTMLHSVSV